jgi:two-component system, chemotaxis family, chemotaxis protein CheY
MNTVYRKEEMMKILIVEDDFVSRRLLTKFLEPYGEADVAVNGREALTAFGLAWEEGAPYHLICLDIMMPEMDGQEVLKAIRTAERDKGVEGRQSARILMATALKDSENVLGAFRAQADGYLVKPIDKTRLIGEIRKLGLIGRE